MNKFPSLSKCDKYVRDGIRDYKLTELDRHIIGSLWAYLEGFYLDRSSEEQNNTAVALLKEAFNAGKRSEANRWFFNNKERVNAVLALSLPQTRRKQSLTRASISTSGRLLTAEAHDRGLSFKIHYTIRNGKVNSVSLAN